MILLQPGYNGSVPDPAFLRIDGIDFALRFLGIVDNAEDEKLGITYKGSMIVYPLGYDQFTTDDIGYTPMASYDDLLDALRDLNAFTDPGVKARKLRSVAGVNAHLVKPGPVQLFSLLVMNVAGTNAYLKLFDISGIPDPAIDTPLITLDTKLLPAGPLTFGTTVNFRKGLAIAIVAGADDGDSTPVGAGDLLLSLFYQ